MIFVDPVAPVRGTVAPVRGTLDPTAPVRGHSEGCRGVSGYFESVSDQNTLMARGNELVIDCEHPQRLTC